MPLGVATPRERASRDSESSPRAFAGLGLRECYIRLRLEGREAASWNDTAFLTGPA